MQINLETNYIGTEHILLALVQESEGIAVKILNSEGIDERTIVTINNRYDWTR